MECFYKKRSPNLWEIETVSLSRGDGVARSRMRGQEMQQGSRKIYFGALGLEAKINKTDEKQFLVIKKITFSRFFLK